MAYQSSGSPVFYTNMVEFMVSNGIIPTVTETGGGLATDTIFKTLPAIPTSIGRYIFQNTIPFTNQSFVAILGHTFSIDSVYYSIDDLTNTGFPGESIVNYSNATNYNGFTIRTAEMEGETEFITQILASVDGSQSTTTACSLVIGTYYQMPHSPRLNLTMTKQASGVQRIRTKGGTDLMNYKYTKNPNMWNDIPAWEHWHNEDDLVNNNLSRIGRRTWSLTFSFLDDKNIFSPTESLSNIIFDSNPYSDEEGSFWYNDATEDQDFWDDNYTLLMHDNFFSQVLLKTNGGQLPFIFQPDSNDANQGWAICKFDMNSFKFKQVSNTIYDISLKIKEVW